METPNPQLEYMQYAWLVIRKRKWLMLTIALIAFALTQFLGYLVTPVWEGTTLLLVERTSKQNTSVFREVEVPVQGTSPGQDAALELIPLLTGWNMAYDVVRECGLDKLAKEKRNNPPTIRDVIKNLMVDAVYGPYWLIVGYQEPNWTDKAAEEFIEDWIDIEEEEEKTSVINVTVNGETPQLATDVANKMAALLELRTQEFTRSKAASTYEVVARQVTEAEVNLKRAEAEVVRFQETNGLYGPDENRRLLVQKLDELRSSLEATRRLQGEVASSVQATRTANQFLQANIALSPVITQIQTSLVALNARKSALLLEKTPDHPDVLVVNTEIERNERQLRDALGVESSMLSVRRGEIGRSIQQLETQVRAMPVKETELARLQQVLTINRSVFETLRSRLEQLAMQQQSMSNDYTIRVLDRAYVPPGRDQDWPLWWLNILAGVILGIVFGVGGAFAIEYWSRPVLAARDVDQVLGLRLLGRFPELDKRDS